MNKKWYESKTIWVNVVATIAIVIQTVSGKDIIPAETQVGIIAVVNLLLRMITKENITW